MLRLLHCYVLCALVLSAQEPSSFGGLRFRDLPNPVRCPEGINDLGEIVRGCSFETDAYFIAADGVETPLPVPGHPAGINNLGQIVLNYNNRITLLHRDGRTESRTVEGARSVMAHGINNKGEIAGEADGKPVIWNADGTSRLLHLPPLAGNYQAGQVLDINDSGTIAGTNSYLGYWLFRWTPEGYYLPGLMSFSTWWVDIANDGTMLNSGMRGIALYSTAVDLDFRTLYNFRPLRFAHAMSPSGRLFAGSEFVAERCTTEVTPLRGEVPLDGGKLRVRVTAESGCEWSHPGGNGEGSAEIELTIDPATEPQVIRRVVAGKDVAIHQGAGACGFYVPGTLAVPSAGGMFRIPVTVTEGCTWSAQSETSWVVVDSAAGHTGSASVSISVEPNPGASDRRATLRFGRLRMSVVQGAFSCTYRVLPFGPLPPGEGAWTPPVETQPGCTWSLSSSSPWLLEIPQQGQLNFAANTANTANTATLSIAGQRLTVTQEPARPGEPYSVEPFDSSGPRQTFRFRFAEPLTHTRLTIGSECTIEFNLGFRPFAVIGTCSLEDASSVVADGFRVISTTVSLKERGRLAVAADGRQLGVYRSTDSPPAPIPITRPLDVPANPPAGSSLWIDSRRGVGGTFRIYVDPSLGLPQSLAFEFGSCIVTIHPVARTMQLENFIEVDGPPQPTAAVPFGSPDKLQTRYCMVDPQRSRLALPIMDLAIFFPATYATGGLVRLRVGNTVTELGTYVAAAMVPPPVVSFHDDLLKFVFRSEVPIELAQVQIGRCLVTHDRVRGLQASEACALDRARSDAVIIGNDVVMTLALSLTVPAPPSVTHIRTNFTPEGFSATGWFNTYLNYLIAFNVAEGLRFC